MTVDPPPLDPSQLQIVQKPAGERCLVIAGAGQGKTEVVAARLEQLVIVDALNPADEILVLSFSRAAVAAARARLRGRGIVARVAVRTFDSFATRLLGESGRVVSVGGYEARIAQATALLVSEEAVPTVDLLRHVVIDEMQDLVGERALFVEALLTRLGPECGFTILGDPPQAIYDFQLDGAPAKMTNADLTTLLCMDLHAEITTLDGHYRARSPDSLAVIDLAAEMRAATTPAKRLDLVVAFVRNLPTAGTLEDIPSLLRRWEGTTAILCQTNGQGMEVSLSLAKAGVSHRLRRPSEDLSVPAWVAIVLAGAPAQTIAKPAVLDLIRASGVTLDAELGWRLLKTAERRRRFPGDLDIVELASRIAARDVPVDLADDGSAKVVVSTIHRAKGLEFDNVVMIEEPEDASEPLVMDARARQLFVGVSRARYRISTLTMPRQRWVFAERIPPKRWIRTGRRGNWVTSAFEVRGTDVERQRPASGPDITALQLQSKLAPGLAAGELAQGLFEPLKTDRGDPVYRLVLNGTTVGYTNAEFGRALATRLDRAWRNHPGWPLSLDDVVVDGVETVAGSRVHGADNEVGRWGLWLAVRVGGLARLSFERDEAAGEDS